MRTKTVELRKGQLWVWSCHDPYIRCYMLVVDDVDRSSVQVWNINVWCTGRTRMQHVFRSPIMRVKDCDWELIA